MFAFPVFFILLEFFDCLGQGLPQTQNLPAFSLPTTGIAGMPEHLVPSLQVWPYKELEVL